MRTTVILPAAAMAVLALSACKPAGDAEVRTGDDRAVADDRGAVIELPSPPARVIVLSPALAEVLYALDLGDRVVGLSRYCNWPAETAGVPRVGGGLDPSIEAVLQLEPDLVLSSGTRGTPALDRLEQLGMPVGVFSQNHIRDLLQDIRSLARIFGIDARGERLVAAIQEQCNALSDRVAGASTPAPERPGVLVLFGMDSLLSAGKPSYITEIIELAGGRNAAGALDEPWPNLSPEALVFYDPDCIVFSLNAGEDPESARASLDAFARDPRWSEIAAVRHGRLFLVENGLLNVPGPRIITGAERLAALIGDS